MIKNNYQETSSMYGWFIHFLGQLRIWKDVGPHIFKANFKAYFSAVESKIESKTQSCCFSYLVAFCVGLFFSSDVS